MPSHLGQQTDSGCVSVAGHLGVVGLHRPFALRAVSECPDYRRRTAGRGLPGDFGGGLRTGHNGRVKVDRYLRVLDHPEIDVAGDLASVTDPRTGHALPPLAQVALEEGETVARNLDAELEDKPLEAFTFRDKGFVVSVGTRRGVADVAGITSGGGLAPPLKDALQ